MLFKLQMDILWYYIIIKLYCTDTIWNHLKILNFLSNDGIKNLNEIVRYNENVQLRIN